MKFKSNIEAQAGIEDSAASAGTAGQLLSSLGPVAGVDGVGWVDQNTIIASAATLVEIECKNTSGSTITKGTPVYQTGNVGATAVIEIAEADALISANKGPAIGLLQDTLTNNAFGFVVIIGELLNLTTSPIDGVTPTVGDKIFVKSGGGLTTVKPTTSLNSIQAIGLVGKVSGGNAGSVTVSSTMRANDVPNLPEGRIWIGDGNTIVSDTVYVDEPNNRIGIGTAIPTSMLEVDGVVTITDRLILSDSLQNSFIGENTGVNNTTGDENIGLGYNSLFSNTTGGNNIAIGAYSLLSNETGSYNIAIGEYALPSSITSSSNIAIGFRSLYTNSSGFSNIGLGIYALQKNTTGSANIAIGVQALWNNTTGGSNSATGYWSLYANTTGNGNAAFGYNSLVSNTTGGYNVAMGYAAGKWIADGSTPNATSENSIFIGRDTKANANSETNQIVIGNTAIGNGSNTVTLGNDSIVKTILKGNVGIGTTSPNTALEVDGAITTTTSDYVQGTTGSRLILETNGSGNTHSFIQAQNSGGTSNAEDLALQLYGGNVGIGTDSPGANLEINDASTPKIRFGRGASYYWDIGHTSSDFQIQSQTGGTIMHLEYDGNVGIGTTSPDRELEVEGDGNVYIRVTAKTDNDATAIELKNTQETWTIKNQDTNDDALQFESDTVTAMTILKAGNVGIGTDSPSAKLQITGSTSTAGDTTLHLKLPVGNVTAGGTVMGNILFSSSDNSGGGTGSVAKISTIAGDGTGAFTGGGRPTDLAFFTQPLNSVSTTLVEAMRIDQNGNVGIGTTSPSTKLDVNGSATINNVLEVSSVDTGNPTASLETVRLSGYGLMGNRGALYFTNAKTDGSMFFGIGGTHSLGTKLSILSSGNVGIGTTSPNQKLHVNGGTQLGDINATVNFGTVALKVVEGSVSSGPTLGSGAVGAQAVLYSNGLFGMYTGVSNNGDTWMQSQRNDASTAAYNIQLNPLGGNVLIGTQGIPNGTSIYGSAFVAGNLDRQVLYQGTSVTITSALQAFWNPNGLVGTISTNGSSTSYNTTSDYRLKEDLQDFAGLDMVSKIPVYDYKWKSDESRSYGVMAHELQEVLPDAVSGKKDAKEMQGVDYSKIVPLLIKSIQELTAKVEKLEANK